MRFTTTIIIGAGQSGLAMSRHLTARSIDHVVLERGYQGGYCFDLTGSYSTSFLSAALAGSANLLVVGGFLLHQRWHARIAEAFRTSNRNALATALCRPR